MSLPTMASCSPSPAKKIKSELEPGWKTVSEAERNDEWYLFLTHFKYACKDPHDSTRTVPFQMCVADPSWPLGAATTAPSLGAEFVCYRPAGVSLFEQSKDVKFEVGEAKPAWTWFNPGGKRSTVGTVSTNSAAVAEKLRKYQARDDLDNWNTWLVTVDVVDSATPTYTRKA